MSVINQVLLDLERRRASVAERKSVPNHVRVMPPASARARTAWAAGLAVAMLGFAAAWAGMKLTGGTPRPVVPSASVNAPAAPRVAPGPPAVAPVATAPERQVAARLSFELSRIPAPLPESEPRVADARPIPVARVIARAAPAEAPPAEAAPAMRPVTTRAAALPVALPAAERAASAAPEARKAGIDKRMREPTAQELAEADYRKATVLLHQGRLAEAREGFEAALARNPAHHAARQAVLGVLIETGRSAEAERVMRAGVEVAPHQIGFVMALARLELDRGDAVAAIATLRGSLAHAQNNGDYLAFLAGLLQREQHYAEAVEKFDAALRVRPGHGVWLLGLGMSLEALGRAAEAREAFRRARASHGLNADLQTFADQRLRALP